MATFTLSREERVSKLGMNHNYNYVFYRADENNVNFAAAAAITVYCEREEMGGQRRGVY